jgi:hypothetical protein
MDEKINRVKVYMAQLVKMEEVKHYNSKFERKKINNGVKNQ